MYEVRSIIPDIMVDIPLPGVINVGDEQRGMYGLSLLYCVGYVIYIPYSTKRQLLYFFSIPSTVPLMIILMMDDANGVC